MSEIALEVLGQADILLNVLEERVDLLEVGIPGTPGPAGANYRGTWNALTDYHLRDTVLHQGSSYVALADVLGGVPGVDPLWQLVAARGASGAGGSAFEFVQPAPAAVWIINHNQGFKPTFVSVMDAGGSGVNCGITHPSVNQTVLSFNPPMAGVARLL